ncbi:MAG: hypothetical protein LBF72_00405 [Holosporales bacterium]|jgi:hypothetical protein|nr:hypothetical protein [Holosporales bacterium]
MNKMLIYVACGATLAALPGYCTFTEDMAEDTSLDDSAFSARHSHVCPVWSQFHLPSEFRDRLTQYKIWMEQLEVLCCALLGVTNPNFVSEDDRLMAASVSEKTSDILTHASWLADTPPEDRDDAWFKSFFANVCYMYDMLGGRAPVFEEASVLVDRLRTKAWASQKFEKLNEAKECGDLSVFMFCTNCLDLFRRTGEPHFLTCIEQNSDELSEEERSFVQAVFDAIKGGEN